MTPTMFFVEMNFCATVCATAGPCSTGVSPITSVTLRPSRGAICLTASLAQLDCSVPRNPAPPVTGVAKPICSGALQLILAALVADDVLAGRAEAAATIASESAAIANGRMNLNLRIQSPCGG